jgi:GT2 family glycosyltransferase
VWNTPSSFINASLLKKVGFFDEKFLMLEDYPLWLKFTKMGVKLNYFDITTIQYIISESTSNNSINWINKQYFISQKKHFVQNVSSELSNFNKKIYKNKKIKIIKMTILIYFFRNKRTLVARLFNRTFKLLFNQ